MSSLLEPRYGQKQTRQDRDLLVKAGFVYAGMRSDGHYLFINPADGFEQTLSDTPSGGWQHKAITHMLRKRYGYGERGGFNRQAQRDRATRTRAAKADSLAQAAAYAAQVEADYQARQRRKTAVRLVSKRYSELQAIQSLMGAKGSCF